MRPQNTAHSNDDIPFPTRGDEVIAWLAAKCREPVIRPGMTEAEIMHLAGRRSVYADALRAYEETFARPGDIKEG